MLNNPAKPKLDEERRRREDLHKKLIEAGGLQGVSPELLRELRIYEGQAGIWKDTQLTKSTSDEITGITVSVLHRGDIYPDDLTEKYLVYHYPKTGRVGKTDQNEIDATKASCTYSLPIFVITTNELDSSLRDIRIGLVKKWDDQAETFFIEFVSQDVFS